MDDRVMIAINRDGVFSLEQARAVLPVVKRISQDFSNKVEALMTRLESINLTQSETISRIEGEVNELIKLWHEKIKKLGAKPKGLWLVDFDAGDGYFCWKYPEADLEYWHSYENGFTGRVSLAEREKLRRRPDVAKDLPQIETS